MSGAAARLGGVMRRASAYRPPPAGATVRLSMRGALRPGYNVMFYCPRKSTLTGSADDFSLWRVDAVRLEGALRGRHDHVFTGPPLRPDRPERRRQVHLHEAADRRAAAP